MSKELMVHVITNFAGTGGVEMMLARLIKQTQHDYDHVIISLMKTSEIYKDTLALCSSYYELDWNWLNSVIVIWRLKKLLKKLKPKTVQCWMYGANFMTSFSQLNEKKRPDIFWGIHHSLNALSEESIATRIGLVFNKLLSRQPTGIIYCANSSLIQHQKIGLHNPNVYFIPNGVPLKNFNLNVDLHEPVVIGFAGRYHPAKGYPYLFEVISKLKGYPVIFKIAGSGVNIKNPEIKAYFDKYLLDTNKVKLLDQISDMPAFYQSIDLFLMTSITEGFPNVLVEALASGLPCISTDVGDAKYIIQDVGNIVRPRDPDALVNSILQYLTLDTEEKKRLKQAARCRAEKEFGIVKISQQYIKVWQSVKK